MVTMRKLSVTVGLVLLLVLLPCYVSATGVFSIVRLDKDFNRLDILMNVYNPPIIQQECLNKSKEEIPCSRHFSLVLPQWLESHNLSATIYEPRRFIFYNPLTSSQLIEDCRKFSVGGNYSLQMTITKGGKLKIEKLNQTQFIRVPFDWNLEKGGSDCYFYNIPIYNPLIVDQTKIKWYPFDSYNMRFGFVFPYKTNFQGLITLPKQFRMTSFSINTTQKNVKTIPTRNVGYFNFKPIVNENQLFYIKFSRNPDFGSKILIGIILFGLPSLLFFFFLFSSPIQKDKFNKKIAFYLAIIPLFFSMTIFLKDKPRTFTLFDASLTCSVSFLILNVMNDFMFSKFFSYKFIKLKISMKFIIFFILFILIILIIFPLLIKCFLFIPLAEYPEPRILSLRRTLHLLAYFVLTPLQIP